MLPKLPLKGNAPDRILGTASHAPKTLKMF